MCFCQNNFESNIDIKDLPDEVPDDEADESGSAKEVVILNDLQSNVGDGDLDTCGDDFSNLEILSLGIR